MPTLNHFKSFITYLRCKLFGHRGYSFYSDGQVCSYSFRPIDTKGNRNAKGQACYQKVCKHCDKNYGPYIKKRDLDNGNFDTQQDALNELNLVKSKIKKVFHKVNGEWVGTEVKDVYQKRHGIWFRLDGYEYSKPIEWNKEAY